MLTKRFAWAIAVAALLFAAAPAWASKIMGTGDSANAISGTVVDFDEGPSDIYTEPVTVDGVTFSADGTFFIGSAYIGEYNTRGVYSLYTTGSDGEATSFTVVLPEAVNAFAFLFGASDVTWRMTAYDDSDSLIESYNIDPVGSSNAGDYFGIRAAGIKKVIIESLGSGDYVLIDNFAFGDAITARARVQRALEILIGHSSGTDSWAEARRFRAIKNIEDSLANELWMSDDILNLISGEQVFIRNAAAIGHLRAIIAKKNVGEGEKEDAQDAIDELVAAADMLAATSIALRDDYENHALKQARKHYEMGVAFAAADNYPAAMARFRNAWRWSQLEWAH